MSHAAALRLSAPSPCDRHLACSEIWGGIDDADTEVRAAGFRGALYSRSCEGGRGGDVHYLSVCGHDVLARAMIADVAGHGAGVSEVGRWLYESLAERLDDHDDAGILAQVNRLAVGRQDGAIATALVASCCRGASEVAVVSAGHHPALVWRRSGGRWQPVVTDDAEERFANLPLGVEAATRYDTHRLTLGPGDRLVLYTDGLVEARGPQGREFGIAKLRWVLEGLAGADLADLKAGVIEALDRHTAGCGPHDDVTFLALEVA